MRTGVLICAGLMLAGCNIVTSRTPLFFAKDAQGQAQLRPGVWMDEKPDCRFDTTLPVDKWPDCADTWVVRPGEVLAAHDAAKPAGSDGWTHYKIILAHGDPPVLQVAVGEEAGVALGYVYAGLKPLKLDDQGRVVEYKSWIAMCGPPPPADATGAHSAIATQAPIEGMEMDAKHENCTASAPEPVRQSVRLSEAWNDKDASKTDEGRNLAHWVRDGEK